MYDVLKPVLLEKEKAEERLKVGRTCVGVAARLQAGVVDALAPCTVPGCCLCCLWPVALPMASYRHLPAVQEVGDKMTFVIVRPGGLKSEPATGTGVLTGEDRQP